MIIPLGWMASQACEIRWSDEGLCVLHPERGELPVQVVGGCPQIPRDIARDLLRDFEQSQVSSRAKKALMGELEEEAQKEYDWMKELVDLHPALTVLPAHLKEQLVIPPGRWTDLPVNRHRRKRLKQGYVAHLYAGEDAGYTLEAALRERNLSKYVLEIDLRRGSSHDMLQDDLYAALLRTALDGSLKGVVGGPNCRSRSVLRHYPGGPRPVRKWGGEEFGLHDLSPHERKVVQDDDLLLWRMIYLGIVGDYVAKAKDPQGFCGFGLEQPACPAYNEEVVSFWRTREWKLLRQTLHWGEQTFNQGDMFERATETPIKPTTWGGNLPLQLPRTSNPLARGRDPRSPGESQTLARWVPGLMNRIAAAIGELLFQQHGDIKLKPMTWSQHVQAGHVPFRRDCRICQESSAKSHPHKRVAHPQAGTLSIDVAGPYQEAYEGAQKRRYMLIGAFTWLKPVGGTEDPATAEEGEHENLPVFEGREAHAAGEPEGDRGPEQGLPELRQDRDGEGGVHPAEEIEERQEPTLNVFKLCVPLESKKPGEVLRGLNQIYIQLRIHGYPVTRLHSDRGREYEGGGLDQWRNARSIYRTTTAGASAQSNGRAERAVQEVKLRMQRALMQAGMGPEKWPLACLYVHEMERRRWADREDRATPPFGETVLVKRRYWGRKTFEPTHEKVIYISPDPEAHGHRVLRENGALAVAPYFIAKTEDPVTEDKWIALLAEQDRDAQALDVRRRIRGKVALRRMKMLPISVETWEAEEMDEWMEEEEKERQDHRHRMESIMEQEAVLMLGDDQQSMHATYEELRRLKQAKMPADTEEDVLRMRIVSVHEMVQEKEKWHDAITGEIGQLFEEKGALLRLSDEEFAELKKKHGAALEVIPMKAVLTKKPGPRRRFRMVACGNYIEKGGKEEVYASGADALTVRFALKKSAEMGWKGLALDIKVAFLNAPLRDDEDLGEQTEVVLKPPSLLVRLGYARPGEHYLAVKAVYGLRQSPRKWGRHRDRRLLQMKTRDGFVFRPSTAEPNLWRVLKVPLETDLTEVEEFESELYGLLVIYVDDILIFSTVIIVLSIRDTLQEEWETSTPEWLGFKPVKFLGMEISEHERGFLANQTSYIWDKDEGDVKRSSKVPSAKDMYPPPEEFVDEKDVRLAQKLVGELLWVSTRTRPEISFSVSRCSAMILTAPKWTCEMCGIIWGYLKETPEEGLWFGRDRDLEDHEIDGKGGLRAYSDISFAPVGEGSISHGAVMVLWNGALMWWRSGKQPFPTLSTAEAELVEAIEAFTLGDSVDALISEHESGYD